ncbi:MAG: hypothetical protein WC595_00050 [Candidatus Nanoarchaeia archaeon]
MQLIQIEFDLEETKDWKKLKKKLEINIARELKREGLYQEDLLYRGFEYSKLKKVLKTGDDSNRMFSYAGHAQHVWYDLHEVINYAWFKKGRGIIAKLLNETNRFGIAVYDPHLLNKVTIHGMTTLREGRTFKEALRAIFIFIPKPA